MNSAVEGSYQIVINSLSDNDKGGALRGSQVRIIFSNMLVGCVSTGRS